jgi:DedD protein
MNNNLQDYDPRQRLTGAIVLFLLAVILLPMLLSHNNDDADVDDDPVVMEITNEGKKVFVSRISALAPQGDKTDGSTDNVEKKSSGIESPTATKAVESSESPATSDNGVTATKLAARRKELEKNAAVEKTAPSVPATKTTTAVIPAGSWILQIGVFSQPENASKKVAELKKKGFDATSGKVKTSKGVVTKVWIGPYKDREAAKRMQDRLQHKTRERGYVVQHKP